jgi:hypothetical protein
MRDLIWLASWMTPFVTPLDRLGREVFLRIMLSNSLEFRVAVLLYQIRALSV